MSYTATSRERSRNGYRIPLPLAPTQSRRRWSVAGVRWGVGADRHLL